MNAFNFNGKIYPAGSLIIGPESRGLRYGDGLFETMRFSQNQLLLSDEHFARLWKGLQTLNFSIPKLMSPESLESEIRLLLKKNNLTSARIRINMFRGNGGLYDVAQSYPNYAIEVWNLETAKEGLQENGLQVCFYEDCEKPIGAISNLKHNNYLPYVLGAFHAKKQHCNDALIFNTQKRICDSTIANVFIVKNNLIYTTALQEGCVAGVMRGHLIQLLKSSPFSIIEKEITKEEVLSADEVFLSNAIYGIRWVAGCEQKKYAYQFTRKLYEHLKQTNSLVFC